MSEKKISIKQGCIITVAAYFLLMVVFWLCAHEQLNFRVDKTDMLKSENVIGEITAGNVFTQNFKVSDTGDLLGITVPIVTYGRDNQSTLVFSVLEGNNELVSHTLSTSGLEDSKPKTFYFSEEVELQAGVMYTLSISSPDGVSGNAVTIFTGRSYEAGKASVEVDLSPEMQVCANGNPLGYAIFPYIGGRSGCCFDHILCLYGPL